MLDLVLIKAGQFRSSSHIWYVFRLSQQMIGLLIGANTQGRREFFCIKKRKLGIACGIILPISGISGSLLPVLSHSWYEQLGVSLWPSCACWFCCMSIDCDWSSWEFDWDCGASKPNKYLHLSTISCAVSLVRTWTVLVYSNKRENEIARKTNCIG
jgi:hypothetical protein